ncbi:MAG: DMT family transporter [Hyphomicrobiaceae bacterium]|nr:MAG: DMT family transporter [Hyphomicrobiaceae bacterium]
MPIPVRAVETEPAPAPKSPESPRRLPLWLALAPFLFCSMWSGGYVAVKIAKPYIGPILLLTLRYAIVVAALLPALIIMRAPLPQRPAQWLHLVVTGTLVQGLYFGIMNVALMLGVPAGVAAIILAIQPILVAVLAPRLVGEKVSLKTWTGLILGLAGAAIVILSRSTIEVPPVSSLILTFLALGFITLGTLYEKRFGTEQHPVVANLVQCAVALALSLPAAILLEDLTVTWSAELVLALGYLAIANSLIAMTLLFAMLRHGEAARVSSMFFLVPPLASALAWAMLGEAMPPLAWFGMALAGAGVLMAMGRI